MLDVTTLDPAAPDAGISPAPAWWTVPIRETGWDVAAGELGLAEVAPAEYRPFFWRCRLPSGASFALTVEARPPWLPAPQAAYIPADDREGLLGELANCAATESWPVYSRADAAATFWAAAGDTLRSLAARSGVSRSTLESLAAIARTPLALRALLHSGRRSIGRELAEECARAYFGANRELLAALLACDGGRAGIRAAKASAPATERAAIRRRYKPRHTGLTARPRRTRRDFDAPCEGDQALSVPPDRRATRVTHYLAEVTLAEFSDCFLLRWGADERRGAELGAELRAWLARREAAR